MKYIYKLNHISKNYGEITALNDLTLQLVEGPIAILGYSGAGKTTLLKLLAGLEMASFGTIRFKGREMNEKNIQDLRRVVTMLFQEPVSFNRTVLENVMYGLIVRGVAEDEAITKAEKALTLLRLEGFENRNATKLSGGEKQRVSLARALVLEPQVLLLDEPTSNLDPANATVIVEAIKEHAKTGLVVISTHNFSDVRRIAKWAIYLEKGSIIGMGTISELLDNPKNERIKRFVNGLF
jgi:tungstate transport system ATP-binding protein